MKLESQTAKFKSHIFFIVQEPNLRIGLLTSEAKFQCVLKVDRFTVFMNAIKEQKTKVVRPRRKRIIRFPRLE